MQQMIALPLTLAVIIVNVVTIFIPMGNLPGDRAWPGLTDGKENLPSAVVGACRGWGRHGSDLHAPAEMHHRGDARLAVYSV